jgi:hypothetical protein
VKKRKVLEAGSRVGEEELLEAVVETRLGEGDGFVSSGLTG